MRHSVYIESCVQERTLNTFVGYAKPVIKLCSLNTQPIDPLTSIASIVPVPTLRFDFKMSSNDMSVHHIPEQLKKEWCGSDVAFGACQKWAKENGFSVHVERSSKKGKDKYMFIVCKHYGTPRNKKERVETVAGTMTYHADAQGNITATGREVKQREKLTERCECPFRLYVRPKGEDSIMWRITSMTKNEHNHPIKKEISSYPMHRRLSGDNLKRVIEMISHGTRNATIASVMTENGHPCIAKDIANIRQNLFNNDPDRSMFNLITSLENDGYEVRYAAEREGDKAYLKAIFFAHTNAIELARSFPEVVSMDATYRTNRSKMPFINVVGIGNVGYPALKSFAIAGGWLSNEDNNSYMWFANTLKSVVYPSHQQSAPGVIVTDSEAALINALDNAFPQAAKFLCQVHLRRNFKQNLSKLYTPPSQYDEFEKQLNFLMATKLREAPKSNRYVVPDVKAEQAAMKKIWEAVDLIKEEKGKQIATDYINK